MIYWGYKPYVPVAERREKALKAANKAKKKGVEYFPIEPYKGAIAKTFWGKAWCSNLEQYSDYESRLPRGRSYLRNGSVIDLKITAGAVHALVMGSELYQVSVSTKALSQTRWKAICLDCTQSIASLIDLLQGKLSKTVMERMCEPATGLFPALGELTFDCSCPDWAGMCKHVAAVLYGVGARLDQQPDLLFTLRHLDVKDLVREASVVKPTIVTTKSKKIMNDSDLADVFGLDIAGANVADQIVQANTQLGKTPAKKSNQKATPAKTTHTSRTTRSKMAVADKTMDNTMSKVVNKIIAGARTKNIKSVKAKQG